jgi:hypothetical protein
MLPDCILANQSNIVKPKIPRKDTMPISATKYPFNNTLHIRWGPEVRLSESNSQNLTSYITMPSLSSLISITVPLRYQYGSITVTYRIATVMVP